MSAFWCFKGCSSLSSIGPMELLLGPRRMTSAGHQVSPSSACAWSPPATNPLTSPSGFPVHCHATIDEVTKADLVIMPAFDGDVLSQLAANSEAVPWVRAMHERGRRRGQHLHRRVRPRRGGPAGRQDGHDALDRPGPLPAALPAGAHPPRADRRGPRTHLHERRGHVVPHSDRLPRGEVLRRRRRPG